MRRTVPRSFYGQDTDARVEMIASATSSFSENSR